MLDIEKLNQLIAKKDASGVAELVKKHNISIDGNNLVLSDNDINEYYNFWDKRQLVKKINLNSLTA